MIKVILGTATKRETRMCEASQTIRNILEDNAIDYATAQIMLDGVSVEVGQMDKTLSDLGITEKCMLIAVVKASNAN